MQVFRPPGHSVLCPLKPSGSDMYLFSFYWSKITKTDFIVKCVTTDLTSSVIVNCALSFAIAPTYWFERTGDSYLAHDCLPSAGGI
jgi:hypothetical protein